MKSFNLSHIICSIIIGISIVLGCFIISSDKKEDEAITFQKPLMTIEETAKFLNISEYRLKSILSSEELQLNSGGSYSGQLFPAFWIGDTIYVSTAGLMEWLNDAALHRKKY